MTDQDILKPISANRRRTYQLSNEHKSAIVASRAAGLRWSEVASRNHVAISTAYTVFQAYTNTNNINPAPRKGRPKVFTPLQERNVLRYVRAHQKWTYKQVVEETTIPMSRSQFKRLLHKHHISQWRAKKRPHLTEEHRSLRKAFCLTNRNTDWSKVIFSDECSIEKGTGKKRTWVWGDPKQKWDHQLIETFPKGKQACIMVWGGICLQGLCGIRSPLVIMKRDLTAKRNGYSAWSYTEAMQEGLLPIYRRSLRFMQDNASIHTAGVVAIWLRDHFIPQLLNWPPYSPGLNPIEHLWARLKEMIYERHPELDSIRSKVEQERILTEVLPSCWEAIQPSIIESLVNSMPARIEACIRANGWQTKY
jgi:transposase